MRMFLARTAALLAILFWAAALAMAAVDLLDPTTADDYHQLGEKLPALANWLRATQWWVPGGWAWALTVFLLWASWPAGHTNSR